MLPQEEGMSDGVILQEDDPTLSLPPGLSVISCGVMSDIVQVDDPRSSCCFRHLILYSLVYHPLSYVDLRLYYNICGVHRLLPLGSPPVLGD